MELSSKRVGGHPKVAVKLAAEDLLQLSTPRPRGHVAHEHPLPSPRCPRPLPATREVREHPKERDIHEYAAVVVVHEDDHALLVAGKMNVLEVGGLEVDGLDFVGLDFVGLEVGGLEVRGTPTGPFLEVGGGLGVRGTPTGPFLEVGGPFPDVAGPHGWATPTGPSHTFSGRLGAAHPHASMAHSGHATSRPATMAATAAIAAAMAAATTAATTAMATRGHRGRAHAQCGNGR